MKVKNVSEQIIADAASGVTMFSSLARLLTDRIHRQARHKRRGRKQGRETSIEECKNKHTAIMTATAHVISVSDDRDLTL
jgi:hypothetical protein